MSAQAHTVNGHDICRVHVKPCGFPADAKVTRVDKSGQHHKETRFYARINNGTHDFTRDTYEEQKYIAQRWPGVT